jgi:hypothetical protein
VSAIWNAMGAVGNWTGCLYTLNQWDAWGV